MNKQELEDWVSQQLADEIQKEIDKDIMSEIGWQIIDRKSTRLNSSYSQQSRMPSSA